MQVGASSVFHGHIPDLSLANGGLPYSVQYVFLCQKLVSVDNPMSYGKDPVRSLQKDWYDFKV